MSKPSTLESRIATALTATEIKSSNLATLIAETETAITTADKTAEEERTKALDPIASPDATKAREAMQAAEFSRDRLRTAASAAGQTQGGQGAGTRCRLDGITRRSRPSVMRRRSSCANVIPQSSPS